MLSWKTIRNSQFKAIEKRLLTESVQVSAQVSEQVNPILQNGQKQQKCKVEQMEFESIVEPIDEKSAFVRHKEAMAKRWFGYYRKCKDQQKKMKLIDQYNFLAQTKRSGR